MTQINGERVTADTDGDFAVFLIGMRINTLWKVHKWLPVFRAMPEMLEELSAHDDSGLLGDRSRWGGRNFEVIQYCARLSSCTSTPGIKTPNICPPGPTSTGRSKRTGRSASGTKHTW